MHIFILGKEEQASHVSLYFWVPCALLSAATGLLGTLKAAFSFHVMHKFILDLRELFLLC